MRFLKLSAAVFIISFAFVSCDKEEYPDLGEYSGASTLSGANEVPEVTTTASGTIRVTYSQRDKILKYDISFIGLSSNPTGAHIHGVAEPGVNAGVLQSFNGFPAATTGSYSGTLLIDGAKFKEELLLAGKYYANIHTAQNTGGQIRGQIILNRTN
jgi:hypothetical protein